MPNPDEIVDFWRDAGARAWFGRSDVFDRTIRERFLDTHFAAARREYDGWAETAHGALALLLLLDQFPRNLFRNSPHAYATDPLARVVAGGAARQGFDSAIDPTLRQFFHLPFSHSEALEDQDRALAMGEASGDPELVKWAKIHRDIIVRFGRFPHRNRALGRDTTPEEQAFLDSGGFSG